MQKSIAQAYALLANAQTVLNGVLSWLKQESSLNGKINGDKLDEKQLAFDENECTELFATHGLSAVAAADAHRRTYGRAARLAQAVTGR